MVTAPGSGAEVIPFLKTWVNLPMAIGFTVLYAKVWEAPVPGSVCLAGCCLCPTTYSFSCCWQLFTE